MRGRIRKQCGQLCFLYTHSSVVLNDVMNENLPLSDTRARALQPEKRGRLRRGFQAFCRVVDRCCTAKTIFAATILLLIATWIYPPWIHYGRYQRVPRGPFGGLSGADSARPNVPRGWFFILDTNQREYPGSQIIMRVDVGRLLLIDSVLAAVGGVLAYSFSLHSRARVIAVQVVAGTLCAVPITVLLALGTLLAVQMQQAIGRHNAELESAEAISRQSDDLRTLIAAIPDSPSAQQVLAAIENARRTANSDEAIYNRLAERFNGFVPIKEIPGRGYKMANGDGLILGGLTEALSKDALRVQAPDLKKITLFDVRFDGFPSSIANFEGRIRNDLSQAVINVVLRASFYDSNGQLVGVRKFRPQQERESYQPGVPLNFATWAEDVGHLEKNYTYTLEVAEAFYEQMPVTAEDEFVKQLLSGQPAAVRGSVASLQVDEGGDVPKPDLSAPKPKIPALTWPQLVAHPLFQAATREQKQNAVDQYAQKAKAFALTLPGADPAALEEHFNNWTQKTKKRLTNSIAPGQP
jgi:hypothetical protein